MQPWAHPMHPYPYPGVECRVPFVHILVSFSQVAMIKAAQGGDRDAIGKLTKANRGAGVNYADKVGAGANVTRGAGVQRSLRYMSNMYLC